jgi:glycosyltransferase involved in cell wall biosynthesis
MDGRDRRRLGAPINKPMTLRCLWVTRLLPYPPFRGGDATYTARLIAALAGAGVRVTVLCHADGGPPPPETPGVEWILVPFRDRGRLRSVVGRSPSFVYRFSTPSIADRFRALLGETWDAVVIDNVAMAGVLDVDARIGQHDPMLIYVSHNHEETVRGLAASSAPILSPRRLALTIDAVKIRSVERQLVDRADLVVANTEADAALYRRRAPDRRFLVVSPAYDGRVVAARMIGRDTPRRILLLGSYGWEAKQRNLVRFLQAAARDLHRAGIAIDVVGSAPDDFVARLRTRFAGVTITGPVASVAAYLDATRLGVVAEEIGGGFKHKVLDYAFNRVPIVALAGSVVGTPLVPGDSILEYPDLASLVSGVTATIDDFGRLNDLQEAAFRAVDGRFNWADRGRLLAATLADMRAGKAAR